MKVAFVTSQFQSADGATFASGPANYLLRVAGSLASIGHKPLIISVGSDFARYERDGIDFVSVPGRRAGRLRRVVAGTLHIHSYMSKRLNEALLDLHREDPIDIVQYTNYRATALHRPSSIPAVMRISSFRPLWDGARTGVGERRGRRVATRLEARSFFAVDALYAPSALVAGAVSDATGREVSVIEPPFFSEVTETDTTILDTQIAGRPFLVFVGSMTERKGLLVLADAMEQIFRRYPDVLLVLAGRDKPFRSGTMVEHLRERAGADSDRILYLGEVPHTQLYPLYAAARGVVLPSLVDNLPNSCLEAMSFGAVVIGTRDASFEQLITDGENGYLADNGDVDTLVAAIDRAVTLSGEERRSVGAAARARMEQMNPTVAIDRLVRFFHNVIGGGR